MKNKEQCQCRSAINRTFLRHRRKRTICYTNFISTRREKYDKNSCEEPVIWLEAPKSTTQGLDLLDIEALNALADVSMWAKLGVEDGIFELSLAIKRLSDCNSSLLRFLVFESWHVFFFILDVWACGRVDPARLPLHPLIGQSSNFQQVSLVCLVHPQLSHFSLSLLAIIWSL